MAGIDANTVLCLHCDGTDASTTFTDSALTPHTVTANGDAQVDTAQSVFGGASALFDGTGDYLSTPDSADWAFGSGDFTIDLRVRFNSIGSERGFVSQYDVAGSQKSFRFEYNPFVAGLLIQLSADGSTHALDYRPAWSPSTNTWYHVALVRNGTTIHAYINGTEIGAGGSIGASSLFNSTHALQVGITDSASSQSPMNGWLDEIRVSKGIARWTSNFTPPAAAYTVDAPTNSVAPVASGTPTVGQTLTTTDGTWTGGPSFTYQWQRDNTGGGSYSNIGSATASTYVLVSGDAGCNVRCVVTATNAGGSASANSNALGLVAAGAATFTYTSLVPSYDLDNVFNRWTVTRDNGSPQTSEDTTSQTKYFLRAKQTQTLVSDDTAALAQAARKIAKFKDPLNRVESVTIMPLQSLTNTAQIDAGFARQLGDRITIKETPPGFAGVQTNDYVIQQISGQVNTGPITSATLTFSVWPP
jgi:hypothetical protein